MTFVFDAARTSLAASALAEKGSPNPWYVRFMVGFGAWLAAIFFIGFFSLLTHSRPAALVFGTILLAGSILLRRLERGDFLNQLALVACLSGQLLILFGSNIDSLSGLALLALLMQGVLVAFYADQTHRLLPTLFAVSAIEVLLYEWKWLFGTAVLAGLLGIAVIQLWLRESGFAAAGQERLTRPVAYGLVIAMFALLLPSIFPPGLDTHNPLTLQARHLWLSTLLPGAALLYLVHGLLIERGITPHDRFAWAAYAAVLLLMWPALRLPVLDQARSGVRVVVLHLHDGEALLPGPPRRVVVGMEVAGDRGNLDAEHVEVERQVVAKCGVRVLAGEVAEVGREERLIASPDAERALQLGSRGKRSARSPGWGAAASPGAWPRERRTGNESRTTESSQRRWIGLSWERNASATSPSRRRASSSSIAIGSSERLPLVSTSGLPTSWQRRWWSGV